MHSATDNGRPSQSATAIRLLIAFSLSLRVLFSLSLLPLLLLSGYPVFGMLFEIFGILNLFGSVVWRSHVRRWEGAELPSPAAVWRASGVG
jgi:hypothetical protein